MNYGLLLKTCGIALVWIILSLILWTSVTRYSVADIGPSAIADGIVFGLSIWVLINGLKNYTPSKNSFTYITSWVLVLTVINWLVGLLLSPPFEQVSLPINVVVVTTGVMVPLIYYVVAYFSVLGNMERKHQQQLATLQQQLKLNQEAGIREMQHRFQPHFLYNSLNTINALIGSRPAEARETLITLSDLLRRSVAQSNERVHDLKEELNLLQQYLVIEQRRFGDRLNVNFQLPEVLPTTPVPPFLLQPVLENAIKFGLYGTLDEVLITVNVTTSDNAVEVVVTNPFDAMAAQGSKRGTQTGLRILRRRLQLLHYRTDLLSTTIDGETFTTRILLPTSLPKQQ